MKELIEEIKDSTDDIIDAIEKKKNATDISVNNAKEISQPVVEAVSNVQKAVEGIKPKHVDNKGELEAIQKTLKGILNKDSSVVIKNDISKALNNFRNSKDRKALVKAIKEIPHNDYTELLEKILKETSTERIEQGLEKIARKTATSEDIAVLAKYLQAILDKENFDLGELVKDGRIKVAVDKVGGGAGGGGATEDKQDEMIAAMGGGYYDKMIDESHTGYTYIGLAKPGTAPSEEKWQIYRWDETGQAKKTYADGTSTFDKEWDEKTNYSY